METILNRKYGFTYFFLSLLVLFLSACGGGGNDIGLPVTNPSNNGTATVNPPPANTSNTCALKLNGVSTTKMINVGDMATWTVEQNFTGGVLHWYGKRDNNDDLTGQIIDPTAISGPIPAGSSGYYTRYIVITDAAGTTTLCDTRTANSNSPLTVIVF